jgi:hypothetical protein
MKVGPKERPSWGTTYSALKIIGPDQIQEATIGSKTYSKTDNGKNDIQKHQLHRCGRVRASRHHTLHTVLRLASTSSRKLEVRVVKQHVLTLLHSATGGHPLGRHWWVLAVGVPTRVDTSL